MKLRPLFHNARTAVKRRHRYRRRLDALKEFLLRSTVETYAGRGHPHASWPLALHLRELADPIYLRVANSDFLVMSEIFDYHEYARVGTWDLPADAQVVDLGANVGLASVYFAAALPQSHLIAVEPDQENCALIERNCRRQLREGRLQVVRGFIAARDGMAGIDRNSRAWAYHKVDAIDADHEAIPCISMPRLLESVGFDRIDLLKCDIEGAEREIFAECSSWISCVRHLVVETHKPYLIADLYADLNSAGCDFEITFELQEEAVGIAFLKSRCAQIRKLAG